MKLRSLLLAALALVPGLALAHPGHGDHDFGWDFSSGALHLLVDHYYWALGLIAAVAVGYLIKSKRAKR